LRRRKCLLIGLSPSRWAELHELASAPLESHVFFAEHFADAVNGLCTTLTTFSVCNATPTGKLPERPQKPRQWNKTAATAPPLVK